MSTPRCVAVYGNTLALAGITIALQKRPDLKVVMIEGEGAELVEQPEGRPDVVIFDMACTDVELVLARLEQFRDLLMIGIDPNRNRILLWSAQQCRALTIEDLLQAIDSRNIDAAPYSHP